MKIYLENKKTYVWQWDTHQRIVLEGYPVGATVHYANCKTQEAPVVASKMDGDKLVADIPPELMQEPHDITVYVCDEHGTQHCHFISVISRQKPESYVYEPVEILRYETLLGMIEELKQNSPGEGGGGTPGQNGITPHIGENGNWFIGEEDTGKPSRGDTGPQGPKGAPGDDYVLTDEDMQEIAGIAAGMVPGGGSDKWEYIGEFSVDADVESWVISEDADGKPIELRRLYFEATLEGAAGATDNASLFVSNPVYPSIWGANYIYCSIPAGLRVTRNKNNVWADYNPAGDGYEIVSHHSPSAYNIAWGQGSSPINSDKKYIGGVALQTADATRAKIGAGSTVKIWGVRM